jgi:hypothetical protein
MSITVDQATWHSETKPTATMWVSSRADKLGLAINVLLISSSTAFNRSAYNASSILDDC